MEHSTPVSAVSTDFQPAGPDRQIEAFIFDLDGVLTDTAELHYQAWKELADAHGIPFNREQNESMRGLSRRESLDRLLNGRPANTAQVEEMMEQKNTYYLEKLKGLTPDDILPGVILFLKQAREAGIRIAIASASRNARQVVDLLGLSEQIDALVDGYSVSRAKPAPDLFLQAAAKLGAAPSRCVVFEDATAGIAAGRAGGMWTVGLGPRERVGSADLVYPSLDGVSIDDLLPRLLAGGSWRIRELNFNPLRLHQRETVFTTGNGYLGTRGSFEEGFPGARPATLVNGVYDDSPAGRTELANAGDWLDLRISFGGETFTADQGSILEWDRTLDMRTGNVQRRVRWRSPSGQAVLLTFDHCPGMADPHYLAVRCQVQSIDFKGAVRVEAGLNGRVSNNGRGHWIHLGQGQAGHAVYLHRQTKSTGIELAMAMTLPVEAPSPVAREYLNVEEWPTMVARFSLEPGQSAVVQKLVALRTSRDGPTPLEIALQSLNTMPTAGYTELLGQNNERWEQIWRDSDIVIEGDDVADRSLRFNLFQLLASAPWHEERVSIPARTLSGLGYHGHIFWDTDIFVVPFFTWTQPQVARNLLMYRYHTLEGARQKARAAGYPGAFYAWESAITGEETTPFWIPGPDEKPIRIWTGELELHINADVAYAVWNYWRVTGDDTFMRDYGAEIILETARFWAARLEHSEVDDRYELTNIVGPDEYHQHVGNNAFTNALAAWNMSMAGQVVRWLLGAVRRQTEALLSRLGLTTEDVVRWAEMAKRIYIPRDIQHGLLEQFAGFFQRGQVDPALLQNQRQSIEMMLGREGTERLQVIKQPDVLMLMYLLPDDFSDEEARANWSYYEPITDHAYGSSLGPAIHAALGARLGFIDEAYQRFMQALLVDLEDLRENTDEGIHAATAGGAWQAAIYGFAGLAFNEAGLYCRPHLPAHWRKFSLRLYFRGKRYGLELPEERSLRELDLGAAVGGDQSQPSDRFLETAGNAGTEKNSPWSPARAKGGETREPVSRTANVPSRGTTNDEDVRQGCTAVRPCRTGLSSD